MEYCRWTKNIDGDPVKEDLRELMKDTKVTYHYDWRIWTYMSKREMMEMIALIALLIGDLMLLAAYFLVGFGIL